MIGRISVLIVTMLACAVSAQAQSLSATAIEIDIADNDNGTEPLLIAAFSPQIGVAPQFSDFAGSRPQSAQSAKAGLPAPSIVLGRVEAGQEAAFGIEALLPATVEQVGFDFSDLEARVALRASDPELFKKLIKQGYVDPPAEKLNAVLQTELARMNCYRSAIDGTWGPGSRRSVTAYFDEIDGVSRSDQEPSIELFRTIILRDDVACPTPVAAAPRVARTAKRQTTTKKAAPRASKPAAVAKPKPASRPTISTGAGIGVFR